MKTIRSIKFFFVLIFGLCFNWVSVAQIPSVIPKGWTETEVSTKALATWETWGQGESFLWRKSVCLKEEDETKGYMLISPESYDQNLIVQYKTLALTPATVLVAMLSVSDVGMKNTLEIPENYDGSIQLWLKDKESYFFAFKNASHDVMPLVRKNPEKLTPLATASEHVMMAGQYYDIEIGKVNGRLWLSINDQLMFETLDDKPLPGGHLAFRIRGTAGLNAACMIKDLKIYTP